MTEDPVWSNIFKRNKVQEENIFSVLKRLPIFQDLSYKELKAIERILHRRTYKADEVIFKEYEPGVGMYIIESGKVNITLGKENKLLVLLSTGDFFGEMALILEGQRTASASATEPTKLLGFFQPDLFNLLETSPKTGNKILQRLAQMIAERLRLGTIENRQLKTRMNQMKSKLDELKDK
ncbi:MAG: cyclic nucleotide-binding domain-containing protein [Calditrichaeota bacterium]|nr:MAG: cyclic nucleotide-binding domain-containing protein [Calditrichota bacterium]MBL1204933.1 cyclic nucleotide-binding domain-containing protein [Calditrichota bacterium]NOG44762.1 cyclic nucleotide-binding domain-containing protein [Calditrichota bacterium]